MTFNPHGKWRGEFEQCTQIWNKIGQGPIEKRTAKLFSFCSQRNTPGTAVDEREDSHPWLNWVCTPRRPSCKQTSREFDASHVGNLMEYYPPLFLFGTIAKWDGRLGW